MTNDPAPSPPLPVASRAVRAGLLFSFFVPFTVYLLTAAPGVVGGDSAELAAGAYLLSFVHAPGYPLYLLVGKLFTCLPVGSVAFRITVMSAFWGAGTAALLYLFLVRLLRHVPAALLAAGAVAFAYTFWQQATTAEVYTLSTFLIVSLFHLALNWDRARGPAKRYYLLLFGLLFGLALCNHVHPVLFIPAFVYFAWSGGFQPHRQPGTLLLILLLAALGLSLYLYLPLRSLADPPIINWTRVDSWGTFISVVTAERFRQQMFSLPPARLAYNVLQGAMFLLTQFPAVGCILGLAGIRTTLREERRWGIFLLLASAVIVLYTINYDIVDIDVYYLPFYLCFAVWLGFELRAAWQRWPSAGARALLILALALPYYPVYSSMGFYLDRSDSYGWPDLAASLETLPPESTVIAYWPHFTALRYQQLVNGVRPDVLLVENSSLDDTRYIDDIKRYEDRTGPTYCTLETALVGTQYNLEADGFFFRVEPRQAPPAIARADDTPFAAPGDNGLAYSCHITAPTLQRRHLAEVVINWRLSPDTIISDTQPCYIIAFTDARDPNAIVYQSEFFPVQVGFPLDAWQPGAVYEQRRFLYVPADAPDRMRLVIRRKKAPPEPEPATYPGFPVTDP